MKRSIRILLVFACSLPLLAGAREETMEERKQRITRKYLQERVEISPGEMVVPDAAAESEEVLASEKFKEPQVALQRQEPGAKMPPPRRRPRPRAAENRNWLLAETPSEGEDGEDGFNPFALQGTTKAEPTRKTGWSAWGTERDPSPDANMQRESRYSWRSHDSQHLGSFGLQGASSEGLRPRLESQYPAGEGSGLFGRQPGTQTPNPIGGRDFSRNKPFNSAPDPSPFLRTPAQSSDQATGSGLRKQQGYIPYTNPYQAQRNQQQGQWGGNTEPRKEYRKQNPFQKWKEQNPQRNDPLRDDAFISETMPKTRR